MLCSRRADIRRAADLCARVFHEKPQLEAASGGVDSYFSKNGDFVNSFYTYIER